MVVGSLELAIKDLIERAENVPECDFGFVGIKGDKFYSVGSAAFC